MEEEQKLMEKYDAYSVLITDEKGKRGTGTLFYTEGLRFFYIFTCAHVIYTSEAVDIHILIPGAEHPEERIIKAYKEQFHYSPIDEPQIIGDQSIHTCDIAIIECELCNLFLEATRYAVFPMSSGERVLAVGYPQGSDTTLYYQQDELSAKVLRFQNDQDYFVIRVDEGFLNAADREAELKGFSGSPVWDEQKLDNEIYLFGGFIAKGVKNNISRGRVNVMNARLLQNLMKDEFGITIETRLPLVPESDMAPGYEDTNETVDQLKVRASWVENERRKAKIYIDCLQLQKAVDVAKEAIGNSEFEKCTNDQKYSIYAVLLEAYRLARDYDIYDNFVDKMHSAGIHSGREYLTEAVRYYEASDFERAERCIEKAIANNPNGNEERVLSLAIRAEIDRDADISTLSEVLGSKDQLLVMPKNEDEEQLLYQVLGYVLGFRFKETGRAIRCLNRSYQISGNPLILESLGITYYVHSIRDAFIEEGKDRVDPLKIYQGEIEKARDAFLRVFSAADEMWMKGTFRRAGLQIFKCFCFMHDNFRIYKHYHDVVKYVEFQDKEAKRDIQICYLDIAIHKEPIHLDDFDALTEHDKKYYELVGFLEGPMRLFNDALNVNPPITEKELLYILSEAERRLKELVETQIDDRIGLDSVRSTLINLYGYGILHYRWKAISAVEKHFAEIKNLLTADIFSVYLEELQSDDLTLIEGRYSSFYEKHRDIISFNEWMHFYIRHGMLEKAKELYDSVFDERNFLIKDQPEYFYRSYIQFIEQYRLDLTPAIRCFVENKNEFKDVFIYMAIEMDLNFATVTFNSPDQMIEDAEILLNEGLYTQKDYNEKCLIINMLNCRPKFAEKYAVWVGGTNPSDISTYERMPLIWKGVPFEQNPHWEIMKNHSVVELVNGYNNENWLCDPQDILQECMTNVKKSIVVDLWTLYLLWKKNLLVAFNGFKTIYITHNTVSMALQEMSQVRDEGICGVLMQLQVAANIKFVSPTLGQQLEVRGSNYEFREIHSACLLAEIMNCPAFVGEFRFTIPEKLRSKVIRPIAFHSLIECVMGHKVIEGQ